MAVKSLLLYVDNDRNCRQRIAFAAELAARHQAHLVGAYTLRRLELPPYARGPIPEGLWEVAEQATSKLASTAQSTFEEVTAGAAIETEWRVMDGRPNAALSLHGFHADLLVLAQSDAEDTGFNLDYRPDDVVLGCGRPALVVPYTGEFEAPQRHAVIAWKAGREAARAVQDALPLLARVERVSVVTIDSRAEERVPGADVALYLARHGLNVETHDLTSGQLDAGEMLLAYAADRGCDLLVAGAYGHSRLRETVLGGMTRQLLEEMTVPVLFSH